MFPSSPHSVSRWFRALHKHLVADRAPSGPRRPRRRPYLEELETRTLLSPLVAVLPIQPQEGLLFNGPVAVFSDPGRSDPASSYSASVSWGDGSSADSVTPSLVNGQLTVTDSHTYAEEGQYPLKVTVTNNTAMTSASGSTPIEVVDQAPLVSVLPINPQEGALLSGPVATFTDPGGAEAPSTYSASIAWGDGS